MLLLLLLLYLYTLSMWHLQYTLTTSSRVWSANRILGNTRMDVVEETKEFVWTTTKKRFNEYKKNNNFLFYRGGPAMERYRSYNWDRGPKRAHNDQKIISFFFWQTPAGLECQ